RGCGANSLLPRGDVVLGDGAAEDVVHELESRPARQRFHTHSANAELAVTSGLLLVLSFGIGLGAYGLAIRNFRGLQRDVDLEALAQLGHYDLDMLLARASQQELLRLRVT